MYSHVTTLTFTVTYEKIELSKAHLLSFVVFYQLFVFFNNGNTVSAEMWVWGFGNHAWYKSLAKSLVFDSWLETFVSLVISKTTYSHFLLIVFSHCLTHLFFRVFPFPSSPHLFPFYLVTEEPTKLRLISSEWFWLRSRKRSYKQ